MESLLVLSIWVPSIKAVLMVDVVGSVAGAKELANSEAMRAGKNELGEAFEAIVRTFGIVIDRFSPFSRKQVLMSCAVVTIECSEVFVHIL